MRSGAPLFTLLVGLAGCAQPSRPPVVEAPMAAAAHDAFRAGDRSGVQAAIAKLDAQLPAGDDVDEAPFTACTHEGYRLRRIARYVEELRQLDSSTLFATGEAGRFVYAYSVQWQAGGKRVRHESWPLDIDCSRSEDYAVAFDLETQNMFAYNAANRARMEAWEAELKADLGESEFKRKMEQASGTLARYRLLRMNHWSPSH